MTLRNANWVGWGIWVLTLVLSVTTLPLSGTAASATSFILLTLVLSTVGAVVVARRPTNAIGWIFCTAALGIGLAFLTSAYAVYAYQVAGGQLPGAALAAWVSSWLWVLPIWLLTAPLLLLFPNGRTLSVRWRSALWISAGYALLAAIGNGFYPWIADEGRGIPNSFGISSIAPLLIALQNIAAIFLFFGLAAGVASLALRYRRGGWVERQQLKWFVAAAALLPVAVVCGETYPDSQSFVMPIALALLPVATGIAILRYRLYDIDIIIRRTLIYSTLTFILALIYVGCIVVIRTLVAPLVGGSELAIVASTLAIAALFTPLRRRIQQIIDRRFYRRKYDAAKVLAAFAATARDETDLDDLTAEMLRVIDTTVQPEFVGLWLREPRADKQRGAT